MKEPIFSRRFPEWFQFEMSTSIGRYGWILLWGIVSATPGEPPDGKRPAGFETVSNPAMQPLAPDLTGFNPRYLGPPPVLPYYQFYAPMPIHPPLSEESSRTAPKDTQKPHDKTREGFPTDPDLHIDSIEEGAAIMIYRKNNGNEASTVTADRNSTDSKAGNKKDEDVTSTSDYGTSKSGRYLSASTGNGTKNRNSSNGKNDDGERMSGTGSSEEDSSSGSGSTEEDSSNNIRSNGSGSSDKESPSRSGSRSTDKASSSKSGSVSTDSESSSGSGSESTKEVDSKSREWRSKNRRGRGGRFRNIRVLRFRPIRGRGIRPIRFGRFQPIKRHREWHDSREYDPESSEWRPRRRSDERTRPVFPYDKWLSSLIGDLDSESREWRGRRHQKPDIYNRRKDQSHTREPVWQPQKPNRQWIELLAKIWKLSNKNLADPKTDSSSKDDKTDTPKTNETVIELPIKKIKITPSDKLSLQKLIDKRSNGTNPVEQILKKLTKQQNGSVAKPENKTKEMKPDPKTHGSGKDGKTDTPTTNETVIELPIKQIKITPSDKLSLIDKHSNGANPVEKIVKKLAKQQIGGVAKLENKTKELKPENSISPPAENYRPADEQTKVPKGLGRKMKRIDFNITHSVNDRKQMVPHKKTHRPKDAQDRNIQLVNQTVRDFERTVREGTMPIEKEDTTSKPNLEQEPPSKIKPRRRFIRGRKGSRRRMKEFGKLEGSLSTGHTAEINDDLEARDGAEKRPTLMEWIIDQANQTKLGKLILSSLPLVLEAMEDISDRIVSRLQIAWDRLNTELAKPGKEESRIRSIVANIGSSTS